MFEAQSSRTTSFFDSSSAIQAKLAVGEAGDRFEREADAVADAVVQRKQSPTSVMSTASALQAKCAECEREDGIQLQAEGRSTQGVGAQATDAVQRGIATQRGGGQPLESSVRREMEQGIGADFSGVRIHTGAPASELNDSLRARAFTHGQDVFFNAGEFNPGSSEGRHLLAHELTHVVQQSRSTGSVPAVQRAPPKPGSRAAKVQKLKDDLVAKYGLQALSEKNGAAWTESQLKTLASLFAKMDPEDRKRLKGVTFVLTDKFESKTIKGKKFTIAGETTGTSWVELTPAGVGDTTLHEIGHIIRNRSVANAKEQFERTQFASDLDAARKALKQDAGRPFVVPADEPYLDSQIKAVIAAAEGLVAGGDDSRAANRQALEDAVLVLPYVKPDTPAKQDVAARLDRLRTYADALMKWSDEREKVAGPLRRLDEFIGIVNKDKLTRRSAIFTDYAQANWPEKPEEFLSEAYKIWVKSPGTVRAISKDLAAWFKRGGHLGPRMPDAPVVEELLYEMRSTFMPAVEGGRDMLDVIAPPPPIQ